MNRIRLIEKTWFRLLPAIFGGLLLLFAAAGIAVAVRWHMSVKHPADPLLLGEPRYEFPADVEPVIGTRFQAVLKYRLPWSVSFRRTAVDPGDNLQTTSEPELRRTGVGWGYFDWTLTVPLQAYRDGACGGGTVTADFLTGKSVEARLPELNIAELEQPDDNSGTELLLAPPIEVKKSDFSWLDASIVACVVMLLSLAVWTFLLGRKQTKAVPARPPWEVALEAIRGLREQVRAGTLPPSPAVAALTDVVRHYLEARFRLRAEHQTTPEFLAELERGDHLLEENDRKFLHSFLAAADMVKFARVPADPGLFEQTSVKAEELVSGTVPRENAARKNTLEGAK